MTMHIIGPWLSTNGKKKSKHKYRSAEEAKRARDLDNSWQQLLAQHGQVIQKKKVETTFESLSYTLSAPAGRQKNNYHIKSLDTGHSGILPTKVIPRYTGTNIIGIGTMHKSNAVPIFSDDEAKSISSMRR